MQTKYTFYKISAGTNHSGAISSDEQIIVWGVGCYLGITKPDEDENAQANKKTARKGKEIEVEPHFIPFPVPHPELSNRGKFDELCLCDKYNMALSKQKKIYYWGMFDSQFQAELAIQMKGVSAAQREVYVDKLLCR